MQSNNYEDHLLDSKEQAQTLLPLWAKLKTFSHSMLPTPVTGTALFIHP